jgi:hypothetical protein
MPSCRPRLGVAMSSEDARARCNTYVYVRDTYRVSRGHGFRLHYNRRQCSRLANGGDLCWQHARLERRGWSVIRVRRLAAHDLRAGDGDMKE